MRFLMKALLAAALSVGFVTAASAQCTPAHHIQTVKPGVLTVAVLAYPPFDNIESDGTYTGTDAAILKTFAEKECLKLEGISVDSSAAIQYIVTGRADISASAWYRTAERAKVVGISDPVYNDTVAIFSREGYKSFNQLAGKTVGTVQGYLWVSDLQKVFGPNLKLYPNAVALVQDLKAGRIDSGVNGYVQGSIAQKKGELADIKVVQADPDNRIRSSVHPAQCGFLYTKDNTALGSSLNTIIHDLQSTEKMSKILQDHGIDPVVGKVGAPQYVQ
jgi:polar amino acid transport system substrate-binding protein